MVAHGARNVPVARLAFQKLRRPRIPYKIWALRLGPRKKIENPPSFQPTYRCWNAEPNKKHGFQISNGTYLNIWPNYSDRKHDRFSPKGSVLEGKWDPLFQGNLGWWNIIIWPEICTWSFLAGNHGEHRFLRFLLVFKQLWKFVGSDCWVLLKPGRRSRHWIGGLYLSDMQRVDDSYFQSKQTWATTSFGVGG